MPPSTKKTPAKKAAASKKGPTPRKRTLPTASEADLDASQTTPGANPEPDNSKYAPTTWGGGDNTGPQDLQTPSGQWCLVRRPGVQGLMQAGVLHNIDRLTSLVSDKHLSKKGKGKDKPKVNEQEAVARLMGNPEQLAEIMHTVDRVVCHVVLRPEISMAPGDDTSRKPNVIYTDSVDLIDKMFIFNFVVGGSRDLESFRLGLAGAMGGVESGEDLQVPPE